MTYQKGVSAGRVDTSAEHGIKRRLQYVQRMLKPVRVVNPYTELIDLPEVVFKPRRTLLLLLSFIETITFYHQYQRERVTTTPGGEPMIHSTPEAAATEVALLKEVLFMKSDELSRACRLFLKRLKTEVPKGNVFAAKTLRQKLRIPASTLKRHLAELVRYGYVHIRSGSKYWGCEYHEVDYAEYDRLKSGIDDRLQAILLHIKELSGSVDPENVLRANVQQAHLVVGFTQWLELQHYEPTTVRSGPVRLSEFLTWLGDRATVEAFFTYLAGRKTSVGAVRLRSARCAPINAPCGCTDAIYT